MFEEEGAGVKTGAEARFIILCERPVLALSLRDNRRHLEEITIEAAFRVVDA